MDIECIPEFEEWQEKCKVSGDSRKDYITWDQYFMAISRLSSMRSKDPYRQVGACIVSNDNRILSIGYNGAPNGFNDENFPWNKEGESLYSKHFFVCHAEMNAILNFRGNKKDLENAKIYVDLVPCNECAKLIIQSGIKEVIYLFDKNPYKEETIAAKMLFDTCNVKYRQMNLKEIEIK